jgi:O-methyltransferase domain
LRTLLTAHPRLRGTLFDLPRVVAAAKPAERLPIAAGDFSAEPLPRGDAYVLSQILHGYADDGAGRIVSRCVEAGDARARILLVEQLISEQPTAGEASFDLFMFTLGGGRQRSWTSFGRWPRRSASRSVRRSSSQRAPPWSSSARSECAW